MDQTLALAKSFESKKVFDGAQDLANSAEIDARNARAIALTVLTNEASVSGGTVLLEGAPVENYGGTWDQLGSITTTGGPKAFSVNINEQDDGMPCRVVRARISGQIANGTIDAYIQVHK